MGVLDSTIKTINHHRILLEGLTLSLFYILFQVTKRLIHLQIAGCLIETAVHRLVELFLLHLRHLFNIRDLEEKEPHERESHDYSYDPNRTFLHIEGKDTSILKKNGL